jgi:hypothetical protein
VELDTKRHDQPGREIDHDVRQAVLGLAEASAT